MGPRSNGRHRLHEGADRHSRAGHNVWSLDGFSGPKASSYTTFLTQPFFNYKFSGGWFVGTALIITTKEYGSGRKWTVSVGIGSGRLIKLFGKPPVNLAIGGYYNTVTPQYGARWQLRARVAVIFLGDTPKGKPFPFLGPGVAAPTRPQPPNR